MMPPSLTSSSPPSTRSTRRRRLLILPSLLCIFVAPYLGSLHYYLNNNSAVAAMHRGCDYEYHHHDSTLSSPPLPLLSSSSYGKIPPAVPNPREGIPNILVTTETNPPFHVFVYPPDADRYVSKNILRNGIYERGTTELFARHLPQITTTTTSKTTKSKKCDINLVLDMGSNLGYYSLLAASRGYDAISFEASPDTAWLQRSSAALNGFSSSALSSTKGTTSNDERRRGSLLLIDKGVSDAPSTGRMGRHANSPGMTSFASSAEFELHPGKNGSALDAEIELVRASDVLEEVLFPVGSSTSSTSSGGDNGKISSTPTSQHSKQICYKLLKIDVEGYELKALRGLWGNDVNNNNSSNSTTTTTTTDSYPFEIIIMEYFPHLLKSAGVSDPLDVLKFIAKRGYEFYLIVDESKTKKGGSGSGSGSGSGNARLEKLKSDLDTDDRVKDVHGNGYHINLLAKRITEVVA